MQPDLPYRPIISVLPAREGFSPDAFGAVSLSVRDFSLHSRYRERLITLGAVTATPFDGLAYEALPINRHWWEPNTRAYLRAIRTRLETLKPALIEVHNRPVIARRIAGFHLAPVVLHLHNDPQEMDDAKHPAARIALLAKLAAVYCISHWVRARFLEGLPESAAAKVHSIHSGITIPEPPNSKANAILFVGRMTPNKGGLEFAQALGSVLPHHPDWQGYLLGGRRHSVSNELSDYEKRVIAATEAAGACAHFMGFTPFEQTQRMFRDAAIVVIPSLWDEPFGRTGIEALAQGCAVITSGRGGLSEIVGQSGILLADVTASSIAESVNALIADVDRRHRLQRDACVQVQHFSIETCTDRLDDIRDSLLTESTR